MKADGILSRQNLATVGLVALLSGGFGVGGSVLARGQTAITPPPGSAGFATRELVEAGEKAIRDDCERRVADLKASIDGTRAATEALTAQVRTLNEAVLRHLDRPERGRDR